MTDRFKKLFGFTAFMMLLLILIGLVVKLCGTSSTVPDEKPPQRVISLAPSITETLFAIGMDKEIIGITTFCDYPPDKVSTKPRIAEFSAPLNIEAILKLDPDLIIATKDGNDKESVQKLISLGQNVLVIDTNYFEDILHGITDIGNRTGKVAEAQKLVDELKKTASTVLNAGKKLECKDVAVVLGDDPLYLATNRSFIGDLVRLAGGEIVAKDKSQRYASYSYEYLIKKNPSVIILSAYDNSLTEESMSKQILPWARWSTISAVKNGEIHVLNSDLISRPGPRTGEGLVKIFEAIHSKDPFTGLDIKK